MDILLQFDFFLTPPKKKEDDTLKEFTFKSELTNIGIIIIMPISIMHC